MKNYSNITPKDLSNKLEDIKKHSTCPTCGEARDRVRHVGMYVDGIIDYLRSNQLVKRESCILCVEKHIGKAKVLFDEILTVNKVQDNIDSKVKIELNYLEIIGNLQAAIDEAQDYLELWAYLLESERKFRYEGVSPDWGKIAELIISYK